MNDDDNCEDEVLGSKVDEVLGSKVDKLSKILIKTSNEVEFIELDIQKLVVPRTDDPII